MDMTDPSLLPGATPQQQEAPAYPLGLTLDNAVKLRDSGHISDALLNRMYPPAAPSSSPNVADRQAPEVTDSNLKTVANQVFEDARKGSKDLANSSQERLLPGSEPADDSGGPRIPKEGVETAELKPGSQGQIKLGSDMINQPQPKLDTYTMDDLAKKYGPNMSGYDTMTSGIQKAAKAANDKAKEESEHFANLYKDNNDRINDEAKAEADRQLKLEDQWKKVESSANAVANAKIDPSRLYANATTGDKVTAGIALFLGAFGGARGNTAVHAMQDAIDRDVKAQQADIQNKRENYSAQANVFQHMQGIFKDQRVAAEATRLALYNNAQVKVQQMAAKYSGPEQQAKALQLIGEIEQKKNDISAGIKMQLMQMQPVGPNANPESLPKDKQMRFVAGYGLARSPEVATDVGNYIVEHDNATSGIDRLIKIANTPGASTNKALRDEAQSVALLLQGSLRTQVLGPGTVNDSERKMLDTLVSNPTAVLSLSASNKTRLGTLRKTLDNNLENKLKVSIPSYKPTTKSLGIEGR